MDESEKANLEMQGLNLVDALSEKDSLIFASSSSGGFIDNQSLEKHNEHRSFEFLEAVEAEDTLGSLGQMGQLPQLSESLESERKKFGKCNLRKSLAWDSAFFTSAGVLDPDELSNIIEGVEKSGKKLLPGIKEDIRGSTDSISTLESESLTLENLDVDLFEDIRASIQKSSKAFNVANSRIKSVSGGLETQSLCSSKKVDFNSQSKKKAKSASKTQPVVMQGSGRIIKQGSGCQPVKQIKPVAKNGDSTSSLPKLPKVIGRADPISIAPTKRASLGAKRVQMERDKSTTVASKGLASKAPGLGGYRAVPKPSPSSKTSSLGSSTATKTESTLSSSSCDSSVSTLSNNFGKSPSNSARRKIDSRNANTSSTGSILKTPAKIASKNKAPSGKSHMSTHLMSSKLSSSASPASSISDCSLESLSSTSTVNQRSGKLRVSLESNSSCRSVDSDATPAMVLQKHSNGQILDGHENQATGLHNQNTKRTSTQIGTHSRPAFTKPSGLRMPSPKIGFFDGVKSLVRTPNGGVRTHSGLPTGLPKVGSGICSPGRGSNKPKIEKLQPATTVPAIGNMNFDIRKSASPLPFQDPTTVSTKVSGASRGVKSCSRISMEAPNKKCGQSCLNAEEVGAEGSDAAKHVPDLGVIEGNNESAGALKKNWSLEMQENADLKDIKVTPKSRIKGDTCDSNATCKIENINSSEKVGDDAYYGQYYLKNNLHTFVKNDEEKVHFEDQVDGLSKHMEAVDQKSEIQQEHIGNSISWVGVSSPGALDLPCFRELTCLSNPTPLSISSTTIEVTESTRTPFSVKNSSCNGEGLDFLTGSSIEVVEKTALLPSESAQKENSI
ncbi:uncharacterized protein LOC132293454 [Cornus florida]|uniref:uncharacterized protein LOC132293454 n=1 Tax=Cornus florida TaxID=4283 RepID=UPI00289A9F65|nr:uncharacterized protein LOC132293454 [Cornus florida]